MGRRNGPPRVRLGSTVLESTKTRLEAEAHRRGVAVGVVIEELALALPAPSWDAAAQERPKTKGVIAADLRSIGLAPVADELIAGRDPAALAVVVESSVSRGSLGWSIADDLRRLMRKTYPTCDGSGKAVVGYEAGATRAPCPWCHRWVWVARGVDKNRATIEQHDLGPLRDSPPTKERRVRVKESKK